MFWVGFEVRLLALGVCAGCGLLVGFGYFDGTDTGVLRFAE